MVLTLVTLVGKEIVSEGKRSSEGSFERIAERCGEVIEKIMVEIVREHNKSDGRVV